MMLNTIIHGRWEDWLPEIQKRYIIDAVIGDPPYGGDYDTDYTRFSGGAAEKNTFDPIDGDDEPFDPTPWLNFPKVTLWGYQHFSSRVPVGSILVWNKRRDVKAGKFLSDCELAWEKGGYGAYCFNYVWDGFDRAGERGKTLHPAQKPKALMRWCIQRLNLPKGAIILNPWVGSGPLEEAAWELGYNFIGIEKKEKYVNIARERLARAQMQPSFEGMVG